MKIKTLCKRMICVVSSVLLLFSASCNTKEATAPTNTATPVSKRTFVGTHDFTAPDLVEKDLLKNGQTEYVLVKPAGGNETITIAETEFKYLFKEATGVELKTITDEGLVHNDTNKYISLGKTKLWETSGVDYDTTELGAEGVRIITKDNTVYLLGGNGDGIIYAVHDFMQIYFNFETYFRDCFVIDRNITDLKLKDFNVTDLPDVRTRQFNSTYLAPTDKMNSTSYDGQMFNYRWRYKYGLNTFALPIYKEFNNSKSAWGNAHNSMCYLPKDQYGQKHPEWYSNKGDQLCYTAGGDEESFEEMALTCAAKIVNSLILHPVSRDPNMNIVTLTMEDNNMLCACDACNALKEKYGKTSSTSMMIMCNRIMEIVDAWMNQTDCDDNTRVKAFLKDVGIAEEKVENSAPYKRPELVLTFFAYQGSAAPPKTVYNAETQRYEPISDEIKTRDDVGVYMAMGSFDFQQNVYSKQNETWRTYGEQWADIANGGMMVFLYQSYPGRFTYFYDGLGWFNRDGYEWLAYNGVFFAFNLGTESSYHLATGWQTLKSYIDAKLLWNSNQDIGPMIERYFDGMFAEAAPIMYEWFTELRLYTAQINITNNLYRDVSVNNNISQKKFWPYQLLAKWEGKCNEASDVIKKKYAAIDPALCQKYLDHIEMEWISIAYAMISLHYTNESTCPVPADQALEFKLRFRDVVAKYPGMATAENGIKLIDYINTLL